MNLSNLDFCFNCAMSSMNNRGDSIKAFAYCFLLFMKSLLTPLNRDKYIEGALKENNFELLIKNNIFEEWDIPFFEKKKKDAKSYFFLKPIVSEFILSNFYALSNKYSFEFNEKGLLIKCAVKF